MVSLWLWAFCMCPVSKGSQNSEWRNIHHLTDWQRHEFRNIQYFLGTNRDISTKQLYEDNQWLSACRILIRGGKLSVSKSQTHGFHSIAGSHTLIYLLKEFRSTSAGLYTNSSRSYLKIVSSTPRRARRYTYCGILN
jgi:hypothetical protein